MRPMNRFCPLLFSISSCYGLDRRCKCYHSHQSLWLNHNHGCPQNQRCRMSNWTHYMTQCEVHRRIVLHQRRHRKYVGSYLNRQRYRLVRNSRLKKLLRSSSLFRHSACKQAFQLFPTDSYCMLCTPREGHRYHQ